MQLAGYLYVESLRYYAHLIQDSGSLLCSEETANIPFSAEPGEFNAHPHVLSVR